MSGLQLLLILRTQDRSDRRERHMATTMKPPIFTEEGELPRAYDPKAVERPVYAWWEASGFFTPPPERPDEPEPFVIILPPPNITGSLHNGHAMYTVEDVLIRW